MSDQVNASPEAIRKLAGSLVSFKGEVTAASKRVQGALRSANWHDSRKEQFEARLRDLQKQIDRFMSREVDSMVTSLNQLARRLDDIRDIRM